MDIKMEESEDNLSAEDLKESDSPHTVKSKPKKRSLIERELETSLTARITSPVSYGDSTSTSRYGRARRLKTEVEQSDTKKATSGLKSPLCEKSPTKSQSPVYKMHASNSPIKSESAKKAGAETFLDNQIESIYQENISLSRFGTEEVKTASPSPVKKYPKVYIRKDLIQKRETDETVTIMKNMFSPAKSAKKSSSTHLNNVLERSSERFSLNSTKQQNGFLDNSSVVKTLDFDSKKKKKDNKESKVLSKSDLFDLEAKCAYQVGDLAWARMGTFPFWPSIVTRDPSNGIFVKKKLFGRIERDVIHVTFFGDNGRRGWIVDTMLRRYLGQLEFENTRENFTPEDKKKDPRLYAAFFVSEKKQALWSNSVEEAEMLLREPKRLRIDIFYDMLEKSRSKAKLQKSGKICRTDSDVSLSESLYDSLFSEDDGKTDTAERSRNKSRNRSLDVFEVVTACLDNMAAKTGITKIQRQSHMDRWLQKAKSKTPEKTQVKPQFSQAKSEEKKEAKVNSAKKKKTLPRVPVNKPYSLRKSMTESQNLLPFQNEHDYSKSLEIIDSDHNSTDCDNFASTEPCGIGIIAKVESLSDKYPNKEKDKEDTTLQEESPNVETIKETSRAINGSCETSEAERMKNNKDEKKNTESPEEECSSVQTNKKTSGVISGSCETSEAERMEDNNKDDKKNTESPEEEFSSVQTIKEASAVLNGTCVTSEAEGMEDNNQEEKENTVSQKKSSNVHDIEKTSVKINETEIEGTDNNNQDEKINIESQKKSSKQHKIEEISPKINGINETTEIENADENSQDESSITSTVTSSGNNNTIEEDNNVVKESSNQRRCLEDNFPNQDTLPDIVSNRDKTMSPVYEDSFSEDTQKSENTIYGESSVESESTSSRLGTENVKETQDDHIIDSTIETDLTEESVASYDDSDYRPEYSTESDSQSEDNTSLNEAPLSNDSIEMTKDNTIKENGITDDIGDSLNDIKKPTQTKSNVGNSKDHSMDEDKNVSLTENLENGRLMNGTEAVISSESRVPDKLSSFKDKDVFLGKNNVDTNKVLIKIDAASNHSLVKDVTNSALVNGSGFNVKEVNISTAKEVHLPMSIPESEQNGFHDAGKHMNGDIDLDAISVHSEDSVTSSKSETKRKLRSKQDKTLENPLQNVEFVKYLEMKQDAIMDENPDLTQEEIVAYLYKTWLYDENSKSDVKKSDDLREMNLVKGLNSEPVPKRKQKEVNQTTKNKLSLHKNSMRRFLHKKKIDDSKMDDIELNNTLHKEVKSTDVNKDKVFNEESKTSEIFKTGLDKIQNKETEIALGVPEHCVQEKTNIIAGPSKKQNDDKVESTQTDDLRSSIHKKHTHDTEKPIENSPIDPSNAVKVDFTQEPGKIELNDDFDKDSIDSEDSEAPLIRCKLRSKARKDYFKEDIVEKKNKNDDIDTISINSEDSEVSVTKRKKRVGHKKLDNPLDDPEFVKYLELKQDALIDENPQLRHEEIVAYLYQTWLYEENIKSDMKKSHEIEQSTLVKGLNDGVEQPKKYKRKVKTEKDVDDDVIPKEKPKRKSVKPYYNEEYSDIEEELEVFEIFKPKIKQITKEGTDGTVQETDVIHELDDIDEVELYFEELAKPKPNVFKGLIREKVCEICEKTGNLAKCKGCSGMFHVDCVNKEIVKVEIPAPTRGRKKKKKLGRRPKNLDDSDDKSQDVSEENNASIEDIIETESHTVDAETLEAQLEAKMKEMLEKSNKCEYDTYSSDDALDWTETLPGKCEIIDVKLKPRQSHADIDYSNFKCKNCQNYDTPICFVCKSAVSKNDAKRRQKCHVAHCHKYYHLECLDHWPQTQFNGGEPSKNNKKIDEYFEALTCPRHVCHTCVSDDPRGCKTRFSGDKLAKCVRCPATYHSFTKCLPAGTQILTASHIICPRHYEHRPGKVPCHVNTGWCFICALGGSLICCEYCPTSFHAECLNIKPPEGGYMCEDCETGRLPLYGEMVWVKLGHYRWWPGIILHPSEIPENLMAVKHNLGEFVVRFFGQYDHYWVNRGRVFPFQEGDSGRISSQKSKIDAAFTTAMEHAQRACEILKTAQPNEEESLDIASSLLPPHYVKLKVNKPCGSLCGRKLEDPESSLTQCECNPNDEDPCGPYSQCLNRMLLTECGPTCKAGDRCNNRAFEKRLYPKLVPYRTPSRGWGLKTLEDIKAGQFVIEYVGELIDEEEFRRRMRRKHEIRDENFYFLTLDKERMIDAGPKGNLARFMNHCCEPNCETQKWTVLGDVRVGLFALYDIPANSEVTFNYNLECAGIEKKRCMCGAKRCSGYIGAKPKQDESQSKKSKLPGKRTYKKRKPTEESPSTKNKPKRPIGRPPKPRELTEIEKDLLIIRNATNGLSSDESSRSMSSEYERNPKALKRKRVSFSTEEMQDGLESPSTKKHKLDTSDVGD